MKRLLNQVSTLYTLKRFIDATMTPFSSYTNIFKYHPKTNFNKKMCRCIRLYGKMGRK